MHAHFPVAPSLMIQFLIDASVLYIEMYKTPQVDKNEKKDIQGLQKTLANFLKPFFKLRVATSAPLSAEDVDEAEVPLISLICLESL